MAVLLIILIVVIVLIILGLGIGGTFEALEKGWNKLPAQNITDNFKIATEKSASEIAKGIDP